MKKVLLIAVVLAVFAVLPARGQGEAIAASEIQLGTPFQSGAVLQRGMSVPVWGWTVPGKTVAVSFSGQTKQTVAVKDGKWVVKLDPLKATPSRAHPAEDGGP